jgi:lactoylglutathione lyase
MHIAHVALWTTQLERCIRFYESYFDASPGSIYVNSKKGFRSCFLTFAGGSRLEVMQTTSLEPVAIEPGRERMGLTHVAIATGSEQRVDELAQRLKSDGYPVVDGPRRTGDGYYECVILDPDGNRIEITA